MKKRKLFLMDIKKEEEWINQQIEQGYQLVHIGAFYDFEKCEASDMMHIVRIDFRIFNKKADFESYVALFEDSGWHLIRGSKSSGCQYFEKVREDAVDDIFSDSVSKSDRYRRISSYWLNIFVAYIPLLVVFQLNGLFSIQRVLHPKDFYYTPGLWEKVGKDFWDAFLFETPFALGRAFGGLLFLFLILIYAFFSLKALYWYRKEKQA